MAEGGGGYDVEKLPIMCGVVAGLLHTKLFKCPGIRVPCVEFQGGFITPKDFTFVGNKHTLKDWKTAIKCRGISLRKMIDSGALDFYNHDNLCTGRCMSRNITVGSGKKQFVPELRYFTSATDNNIAAAAASLGQEGSSPYHLAGLMDSGTSLDEHAYTVLKQMPDPDTDSNIAEISIASVESLVENGGRGQQGGGVTTTIKKEPDDSGDEEDASPVHAASGQGVRFSSPNGAKPFLISPATGQQKSFGRSKYDVLVGQGEEDFENLAESFPNVDDFLDESQQFWQSILKLGLMDSVIREIKFALDQMRTIWVSKEEVAEDEAKRMSLAISNLGLTQVLKIKLAEHQTSMSKQNIKLQMEIEDLKRKLAESERKKKKVPTATLR